MPACRLLTNEELEAIYKAYGGRHRIRNQTLHALCIGSGLRISEALSLRVKDVLQNRKVVNVLVLQRKSTKGRVQGRAIELTEPTREALRRLLHLLYQKGYSSEDQFIFRSENGGGAISKSCACKILQDAVNRAGIRRDLGTIGTHSWRKSFAYTVYMAAMERFKSGAQIDPLRLTQNALGHKSVSSTEHYLPKPQGLKEILLQEVTKAQSYVLKD